MCHPKGPRLPEIHLDPPHAAPPPLPRAGTSPHAPTFVHANGTGSEARSSGQGPGWVDIQWLCAGSSPHCRRLPAPVQSGSTSCKVILRERQPAALSAPVSSGRTASDEDPRRAVLCETGAAPRLPLPCVWYCKKMGCAHYTVCKQAKLPSGWPQRRSVGVGAKRAPTRNPQASLSPSTTRCSLLVSLWGATM